MASSEYPVTNDVMGNWYEVPHNSLHSGRCRNEIGRDVHCSSDSLRHVSSPSSARSMRGMSIRPPQPGDFGGPSFYAPQMYPYRPYYVGPAPVANVGYTSGSPMTYNFQPFPPRRSVSLPRRPPSVDDLRSARKPSKPRKPHKALRLPCGRKVDITKKNLYIKQWRDEKLPFNWGCCWILALLILLIVFLLIIINHQGTTEEHPTRNTNFDVTDKPTQEVSEWNVSVAFITTTPQ